MKKSATLLWGAMSESFVRSIRSPESFFLACKHPNAFVLLHFIAHRARRENGNPDGLKIGQCHIGDYKEYGLTEKEYRTAKKILVQRNHIKIIETCRSRKKEKDHSLYFDSQNVKKEATERATVSTTIGTLVELCSSTVYDINPDLNNQQKGDRNDDRGATEGRPKGDEQEGIRRFISNDINQEDARRAERPRSKDSLSFDFEKWEFIGFGEKDLADWKAMYPHIDVPTEIIKSISWLKSNPTKSGKTLWRKFLTGWLQRANDGVENKKAFRTAFGGTNQDRRTKDIHGNPVESPHTGRF